MISKLITKVRTVEERDMLKKELETLLDSLYTEKGSGFESALKSKGRFWVSEIIRNESSGGPDAKFKVLTLRLAFEPTDTSIDKFIAFTRKNVGESVILDFEYYPRLLGGAVITYEGEYRDFSLKRIFESEYAEKSTEVLKMMYSR